MDRALNQRLADEVFVVLRDTSPESYHDVLHIVAMRRRFRPPHIGLQNVIDQVLHTAYAAIVFLPVLFWPSYWTAALSGFLLGGIREVEQYKNVDLMILMLRDRIQDAFFFALGAVMVYHLSR
ncbi:MAG: hypothetical protein ACREOO_22985 [bacterium]